MTAKIYVARAMDLDHCKATSASRPILLRMSKVAAPRIFRQNKKRGAITDWHTFNRVAEAAGESDAGGSVPSRLTPKAHLEPAEFLITVRKDFCNSICQQQTSSVGGHLTR